MMDAVSPQDLRRNDQGRSAVDGAVVMGRHVDVWRIPKEAAGRATAAVEVIRRAGVTKNPGISSMASLSARTSCDQLTPSQAYVRSYARCKSHAIPALWFRFRLREGTFPASVE